MLWLVGRSADIEDLWRRFSGIVLVLWPPNYLHLRENGESFKCIFGRCEFLFTKTEHIMYGFEIVLCIFSLYLKVIQCEDDDTDRSACSENEADQALGYVGPQPVSIMKARWHYISLWALQRVLYVKKRSHCNPHTLLFHRQLLSWYTMSQNQKLSPDNGPLDPLWVRCDMTDPSGTCWLGAETVHLANKVTGVKLYSVTCKGMGRGKLITLL